MTDAIERRFDHLLKAMVTRPPLDAGKTVKAGQASGAVALDGAIGTGWDGADGTRHPLSSAILILHHRYADALRS